MAVKDRIAVVTGASGGIGRAIVETLTRNGARVHGLSRRRVEGIEGQFESHGVDVTDQAAVQQAIEGIGERGGIDILILAAGLQIPDRRLEQLTPDSWNDLIDVNLNSAFYSVHAAFPYLRQSRGDVVFLNSASALWPDLSGPAYQAAKLGLVGFARGSAIEEHHNGIRFCSLILGMTNTPMVDRRPTPVPSEIRVHTLDPQDVADACLFVVSLRKEAHIPELTILPTALQAQGKAPSGPPPQSK